MSDMRFRNISNVLQQKDPNYMRNKWSLLLSFPFFFLEVFIIQFLLNMWACEPSPLPFLLSPLVSSEG